MNRLDHATNIENILFCDIFDGSTDIVIKWKLHKYQHHFDIVRITGYQILSTSGKTMEFVTHDKRQQEQTCRVSCWMIRLGEMFWKCCLDISYTGIDIQ